MILTRRSALLGLTSAVTLAGAGGCSSLALAAAATDQRFVVVILRGALDGMSAVVPYGDPALAALRGPLLPPMPGAANGLLDLGGFFGLHPKLAGLHTLYRSGEFLPVHAVAGPYRSRSHFEAQDYMECGADQRMTSGWLNRVVQAIPAHPENPSCNALSIGVSVPLLLRGPAPVGNFAPAGFANPSADLYARVLALHQGDRISGSAIAEALKARGFSADALTRTAPAPEADSAMEAGAKAPDKNSFPRLAAAAGQMLAAPDGPRIAALEIGGWDTHAGQSVRLNGPLSELDTGLMALRTGLGDAWARTAVLVMTEFGRTARINGTGGTDHGTGTVAFLLGGRVAGGRVRADWPGLSPGKLLDNRDLQPTADLRTVAKAVLSQHLGLSDHALASVFPDSAGAAAMRGVLRV